MRYPVTVYPSIYSRAGVTVLRTWPELLEDLGRHLVVEQKDRTPGFGPYALDSDARCRRPDHADDLGPHRCDGLVRSLTLAVFDVDCGTINDVLSSDDRLQGTARLWYSTHSYRPDAERPSLRLVVPLLRPVPAERWLSWRQSFIRFFRIPADLAKCGGLSHFYYAPSHPPDRTPLVHIGDGEPFDPDRLPSVARTPTTASVPALDELDEPVDPVRLEEHRRHLEPLVRRWDTSPRPESRARAAVLRAVLDGEPLAAHGSRNATTSRTAFDLARVLTEPTPAEVLALLAPSVRAMRAEGSSLTLPVVARMVASAFGKVRAAHEREEALVAYLTRRLNPTSPNQP